MSRVILSLSVLAAVLGACTAPPDDQHLDVVFDVCEPLAVHATGATAAQLASIDAAVASWRARGVAMAVVAPPSAGVPFIEVRFTEAAPAFHGVYEDEIGVVYVNVGLEVDELRTIAIAHELGHAFGLWHVAAAERASVMNPGNLSILPNDGDHTALAAVWGECAGGVAGAVR